MSALDDFLSGVQRDVLDPPTTITSNGSVFSCPCGHDTFTPTGDGTFQCRECTRVWEGDERLPLPKRQPGAAYPGGAR